LPPDDRIDDPGTVTVDALPVEEAVVETVPDDASAGEMHEQEGNEDDGRDRSLQSESGKSCARSFDGRIEEDEEIDMDVVTVIVVDGVDEDEETAKVRKGER
jgi:hypothetical protein